MIAAAGSGARLGGPRPKALLPLGGVTLLARSLRTFLSYPGVAHVVAAVPDEAEAGRAVGPLDPRARLVAGGATRQASVRAALAALPSVEVILVHDAARPFVERALIDAVVEGALRHGAAIPGIAVPDTVKEIGAGRLVAATLRRETLVLAQTPQGFRDGVLRQAHAEALRAGYEGTDDASLVERLGGAVAVVPGSSRNLKITTVDDLAMAEAALSAAPAADGGAPRGGSRHA